MCRDAEGCTCHQPTSVHAGGHRTSAGSLDKQEHIQVQRFSIFAFAEDWRPLLYSQVCRIVESTHG